MTKSPTSHWALSEAELRRKIPGGASTPEARRRLDLKPEVIETDDHGFPVIVRERVRNKFLDMKELSHAEATAALKLRALAEQHHSGMVPAYEERVDHSPRPGGSMIMRVNAEQQVNAALAYLGPELGRVAEAYILERNVPRMGSSFRSIGAYCLPEAREEDQRIAGKAAVVLACRTLAIHFKMAGGYEFETAQSNVRRYSQRPHAIPNSNCANATFVST